jgi:hypothetical protein
VATGVDADAVRSISQAQVSDQLCDNDPENRRTPEDGTGRLTCGDAR